MVHRAARITESTIPQAVLAQAERRRDRTAMLAHRDGSWSPLTFGELSDRIVHLAGAIQGRGVAPGDRIALLGPNSPDWGTAYLAILRAGAIVVPLDRLQTPDEWLGIMRQSEVCMLFCDAPDVLKIRPRTGEVATLDRLVVFDGHPEGTARFEDLIAEGSTPALLQRGPDDLAAILFTSGTTGRSKGVMLSHRSILHDAGGMLAVVDIDGDRDAFLSVLPMHHCYECTCGFLAPLLAGARIYYARSLAPTEIITDLQTSRATFLLGVPLLYGKIYAGIRRGLRAKGAAGKIVLKLWDTSRAGRGLWGHRLGRLLLGGVRQKAGLGTMRYMVSGGAPLPPDVGFGLESLGVRVLQGYGLTETAPVVSLNSPARSNPASVGQPLPGVEIRIDDPDREGRGEIHIRGPVVMQGYWRDEEATRSVLVGDWFKTGDLGRFDRDGYLHITGRSKNLIVSPGGKNISPEEVEMAALCSMFIAEILVCGVPAKGGGGEDVFAYVYPDYEHLSGQGLPATTGRALEQLMQRELQRTTAKLAPYKRIVRFELTSDPFEKTTTQKIKRHRHTGGATDDIQE